MKMAFSSLTTEGQHSLRGCWCLIVVCSKTWWHPHSQQWYSTSAPTAPPKVTLKATQGESGVSPELGWLSSLLWPRLSAMCATQPPPSGCQECGGHSPSSELSEMLFQVLSLQIAFTLTRILALILYKSTLMFSLWPLNPYVDSINASSSQVPSFVYPSHIFYMGLHSPFFSPRDFTRWNTTDATI